jgi:alpha-galactosidase
MALDAHDVLQLSSIELVNDGHDVLDVQWLAAGTLPLPGNAHTVRSYTGQWATNFSCRWTRSRAACGSARTGAAAPRTTVFPAPWSPRPAHRARRHWSMAPTWPGRATTSRPSSGCTTRSTSGSWANGWRRARCCWRRANAATPRAVASCSAAGLNGLAANFHAEPCAAAALARWHACARARCT